MNIRTNSHGRSSSTQRLHNARKMEQSVARLDDFFGINKDSTLLSWERPNPDTEGGFLRMGMVASGSAIGVGAGLATGALAGLGAAAAMAAPAAFIGLLVATPLLSGKEDSLGNSLETVFGGALAGLAAGAVGGAVLGSQIGSPIAAVALGIAGAVTGYVANQFLV